jgi:hypothetical protein
MTTAVSRFQQRLQVRAAVAAKPRLVLLPTAQAAHELANEQVDEAFVYAGHPLDATPSLAPGAYHALVLSLGAEYDCGCLDTMMLQLRTSVLQSIAEPFGIGKLLSAYDQRGGDVNTIHNVRKGVYASNEERERHEQRTQRPSSDCYQDSAYRTANEKLKADVQNGIAVDAYTGETISPAHKHDRQMGPSLDHVVPLAEIEADPGRTLAGASTPELANIDANLASTTGTVNSFLKDRSPERVEQLLREQAPARRGRIEELKAHKNNWTDKERKEYNKLTTQERIDVERLKEMDKKARAEIDAKINAKYYTSGKFFRASGTAAAKEGGKMGGQQALGVLLVEFFSASIDEITDLYRHGRCDRSLLKEMRVRLTRVAARVAARWRDALSALRDGFVAGLMSSLATTLINAFVTTGRRVVRMIREGGMSLVRAVKLVLFRPHDLTPAKAWHEATKVLAGAGVLVAGIAMEEVVSTQLSLVGLDVLAAPATAAIVGALTALTSSLVVFAIDQFDAFGVQRAARDAAVGRALKARLIASFDALEAEADAMERATSATVSV